MNHNMLNITNLYNQLKQRNGEILTQLGGQNVEDVKQLEQELKVTTCLLSNLQKLRRMYDTNKE